MANSYVDYTGNGSTTTWSIPFPFISRTDVSVIKLSDDSAISFTFVNDSQITISPAVADTITFRVRRLTQNTSRLTDFINGSNLTEADLDLAMNQDFFLAQENKDYLNSKVGVPTKAAIFALTAALSAGFFIARTVLYIPCIPAFRNGTIDV